MSEGHRSGRELGYQPGLDTLRAVAISLILAIHLVHAPRGGFLGVDLFFVLSGFLITSLLLEELERHGTVSLRLFYARRALRLFPALWVFLPIAVVGFVVFGTRHDLRDMFPTVGYAITYTTNIARGLGDDNLRFAHLWSLAVEEQFYIVWPVLLLIALRISRSYRAVAAFVVSLVTLIALARWAFLPSLWQPNTRFDVLLIGCVLALTYRTPLGGSLRRLAISPVAIGLSVAVVAWLIVSTGEADIRHGTTVLAAICTCVLLLALLNQSGDPPWLRSARAIVTVSPVLFVGRISYALYLWHYVIAKWSESETVTGRLGTTDARILALVGSLAAATGSYYLVERRFLRLKRRIARTDTHDLDVSQSHRSRVTASNPAISPSG